MAKGKDEMRTNQTPIRALVDARSQDVLERWADRAGRSKQMHSGLLLRRLVELYERKPETLIDLGLAAKSEVATAGAQQ